MHRIDGPGATVDNKFTDGDPVGGVQATLVTDDWLNDMQEELMSMLAAGGITPAKGVQDQVLRSMRKINTGIIGQSRNLACSVTSASATAAFTADELVVQSGLGGLRYCISGVNKTISLAATGAGGMDAGTAPVNGFVAVYAIFNPTTGVSALLAVNATSVAQPEAYSGSSMPAGYVASALVAVLPTNSSGQFPPLCVRGRSVDYFKQAFAGALGGSFTILSLSGAVPLNAKSINCNGVAVAGAAGTISLAICPTSAGQGTVGYSTFYGYASGAAGQVIGHFRDMTLTTSQTVYIASGGPVSSATINLYGYTF